MLVGYEGTGLPRRITEDSRIRLHRIKPSELRTGRTSSLGYAMAGALDAMRVGWRLWRALRRVERPNLVLVQNPPAFPTLAVTLFSLRRRGVRFIIDWHNVGYTLLGRRLGSWHPAVRLARWSERRDARRVDGHLCVSRGLAMFLQSRFGVKQATVLYDRPGSVFAPMEHGERERFRQVFLDGSASSAPQRDSSVVGGRI